MPDWKPRAAFIAWARSRVMMAPERPYLPAGRPAAPQRQALRAVDQAVDEAVVDAGLRDHAARCGAALARRAVRRPEDRADGEVEVGVVEHDDGVLAAELQVRVLEH